MAKKHVLLIANNAFKDGRLAGLPAPGDGYADLALALKDPQRGGFTHVEALVNFDLGQIQHALDRFCARKPEEDFLLVYFCGHGIVDADGELFLALKETDRTRLKATGLMASVLGMNMDLCASPHKALILDYALHAPYAPFAAEEGAAPSFAETLRVHPEKIFAGRGLSKSILSSTTQATAGIAQGNGYATGLTRVLVDALKPGSSAKKIFTVDDWWNSAMALGAAAAKPLLQIDVRTIGMPAETLLFGGAAQRLEMSMASADQNGSGSSHANGEAVPARNGAHGAHGSYSAPESPARSRNDLEWDRLDTPIPLDLLDPEFSSPAPNVPGHVNATGIMDVSSNVGVTETEESDTEIGELTEDDFARLRARVEAQEEVEKEAALVSEREEAMLKARLEQWKSATESLAASGAREEAERREEARKAAEAEKIAKAEAQAKRPVNTQLKMLSAMQNTIFMDSPGEVAESGTTAAAASDTGASGANASADPCALNARISAPTSNDPLATIFVAPEEFVEEKAPLQGLLRTPGRKIGPPDEVAPARRKEEPKTSIPKSLIWLVVGLLPVALAAGLYAVVKSGLYVDLERLVPFLGSTPSAKSASVTPALPSDKASSVSAQSPLSVLHVPAGAPASASVSTVPAVTASNAPASVAPAAATVPTHASAPSASPTAPAVSAAPAPASPATVPTTASTLVPAPAAAVTTPGSTPAPASTPSAQAPTSGTSSGNSIVTQFLHPSKETAPAKASAGKKPSPTADGKASAPAHAASMKPTGKLLAAKKPSSPTPRIAIVKGGSNANSIRPEIEDVLKTSLQMALNADADALQAVYERFALGSPGLTGDIVIGLTVDPSGRILGSSVFSSNTNVPAFDQEVLRRVQDWKLGAFPDPHPKSITLPLYFPGIHP